MSKEKSLNKQVNAHQVPDGIMASCKALDDNSKSDGMIVAEGKSFPLPEGVYEVDPFEVDPAYLYKLQIVAELPLCYEGIEEKGAQILQDLDSEEYGFEFPQTISTIPFTQFCIIQQLIRCYLDKKREVDWNLCLWWADDFTERD
eukprot:TRINITY_DN3890_c0_g2_i1.p1 TRINITY_DN3890_c0_g2~~TRINITY_DN3890_c0_g2_i1.p1  ORF type:complete len:145 (+),score=22.04 TRINITY_DN3890_c0_g2_i1:437-871(+)